MTINVFKYQLSPSVFIYIYFDHWSETIGKNHPHSYKLGVLAVNVFSICFFTYSNT